MKDCLSGYIEDHVHYLPVRVYYSDTDTEGVVYHSRYLDMAEHARSELLRILGGDQRQILREEGIGFVIRSLNIVYNSPSVLGDTLSVQTRLTKCEVFTLIFDQRVFKDQILLCELQVKAGCVSLKTGRPSPMPVDWKQKIETGMIA